LRRVIADLAVLGEDDLAAVLQALNTGERSRVETLLAAYAGHDDGGLYDVARLSPWLVAHIEKDDDAMTAHARTALRACAVRLYPLASDGSTRSALP
jgi:hypothetical protein